MLPLVAELTGATVVGAPARQELGQLGGRLDLQFHFGKNDGSADRVLASWVVQAPKGSVVKIAVSHQRAGSQTATLTL